MTLQEAKSIARHLGLTLRKVRSGDYRVNFPDADDSTAYYTDNLEDAINAAVEMARKRAKRLADRCETDRAMTKSEKRCSHCGGKFGLICYHHWGLRFCRKACKDNFIAKAAKDYARLRKWLGFCPTCVPRR